MGNTTKFGGTSFKTNTVCSVPPINGLLYSESRKFIKEKDVKVRKTQSTMPTQLQQSRDRDPIILRLRAKAQEKDQAQKQLRELVLNMKA